jgi:hypothetical protein
MKIIQKFLICVFLTSATFGFAERKSVDVKSIEIIQTQNSFPNIFRPITDFVKRIFGKKPKPIVCYFGPEITILNLDETEVGKNCVSADNHNILRIKVSAEITSNSSNEYFLYRYEVSGGKIIGQGKEVIWDLSEMPKGTYTITANVDNGCSLCGKAITKSVSIFDCPK